VGTADALKANTGVSTHIAVNVASEVLSRVAAWVVGKGKPALATGKLMTTLNKAFDPNEGRDAGGKWTAGGGGGENEGGGGGKTEGGGGQPMREFRSHGVPPRHVSPVNLVGHHAVSRQHLESLAADMRERGWVGRPLLTVKDEDGNHQALTGSHRLRAAELAGLDEVPATAVSEEEFLGAARRAGFELEGMEDSTGLDDEERAQIADELGGDAAELMRLELEHWGEDESTGARGEK
jgi:hypothetical protein